MGVKSVHTPVNICAGICCHPSENLWHIQTSDTFSMRYPVAFRLHAFPDAWEHWRNENSYRLSYVVIQLVHLIFDLNFPMCFLCNSHHHSGRVRSNWAGLRGVSWTFMDIRIGLTLPQLEQVLESPSMVAEHFGQVLLWAILADVYLISDFWFLMIRRAVLEVV